MAKDWLTGWPLHSRRVIRMTKDCWQRSPKSWPPTEHLMYISCDDISKQLSQIWIIYFLLWLFPLKGLESLWHASIWKQPTLCAVPMWVNPIVDWRSSEELTPSVVSGARWMNDPWAEYRQRMVGAFNGQATGQAVPTTSGADASARTSNFHNPGFSIPCSSTSRPAGLIGNQFYQNQATQFGHPGVQTGQPSYPSGFNAASFASALGSASGQTAMGDNRPKSSAFDLLGGARPFPPSGNTFGEPGPDGQPTNAAIASALHQLGEKKPIPTWNGNAETLRSWLKVFSLVGVRNNTAYEQKGNPFTAKFSGEFSAEKDCRYSAYAGVAFASGLFSHSDSDLWALCPIFGS